MKKILEESTLAIIKENTERNNHAVNLVLIAREVGIKSLIDAAQSALNLQNFFGELTPELQKIRQEIYRPVLFAAKHKFANYSEIINSL